MSLANHWLSPPHLRMMSETSYLKGPRRCGQSPSRSARLLACCRHCSADHRGLSSRRSNTRPSAAAARKVAAHHCAFTASKNPALFNLRPATGERRRLDQELAEPTDGGHADLSDGRALVSQE